MDGGEQLRRGRASFADQAWGDAYAALSRADELGALAADDLELLATAAYLVGREAEFVGHLERAHQQHAEADRPLRAARCALWVGLMLALRGELGPANGWFSRARRLVDAAGADGVERGYVRLPELLEQVADGRWEDAATTADEIARTGERFGDRDLFALAAHEQGHALVRLGQTAGGFGLLDEAMLAATRGELSPVVTGLVYCGVIAYCQELHDLRRAREWTAALTRWCDEQPQMVAYTGLCLVHRAEILQAGGAWHDALEEARRAQQRLLDALRPGLAGYARYRQGELHRLRGELRAAEAAYREASRLGWQPQPGLALLRLAEGDADAAVAAIRRAVVETTEPLDRAGLLPACVEIELATFDVVAATEACHELEEIARGHAGAALDAAAAGARGAVALAEEDAPAALVALRRAWQLWRDLDVPYEAARTRVLVGLACRVLGDDEAAALELSAARDVFAELGAAPDASRVDALLGTGAGRPDHGLTRRELEVLRLVIAGHTNRAIAAKLVVSERTVDRHVSNILMKLGVPSRAAATAYAYEHELI